MRARGDLAESRDSTPQFSAICHDAAKFQLKRYAAATRHRSRKTASTPADSSAIRLIPRWQRSCSLYQRATKRGRTGEMFAWILIGLISGWLAGKILNGNGYGMMADIGLGLLGGIIVGMIFAVLGVRAHNFVGAILMSTAGATALVVATRIIRDEI